MIFLILPLKNYSISLNPLELEKWKVRRAISRAIKHLFLPRENPSHKSIFGGHTKFLRLLEPSQQLSMFLIYSWAKLNWFSEQVTFSLNFQHVWDWCKNGQWFSFYFPFRKKYWIHIFSWHTKLHRLHFFYRSYKVHII